MTSAVGERPWRSFTSEQVKEHDAKAIEEGLREVKKVVHEHFSSLSHISLIVMEYLGEDQETAVGAYLGNRRMLWEAVGKRDTVGLLRTHTLMMCDHRQTFMGFLWDAELDGHRISLMGTCHQRMEPRELIESGGLSCPSAVESVRAILHPEVRKRCEEANSLWLEGPKIKLDEMTTEEEWDMIAANVAGGHEHALSLWAKERRIPINSFFDDSVLEEEIKRLKDIGFSFDEDTNSERVLQMKDSAAWGNFAMSTQVCLEEFSQEAREILFDWLNTFIFPKVLELLKAKEKTMVAVGSAHFIDGLKYLTEHGVKVTRVPMRPIV